MLFVPCDDMVDALATDCPDQPLGKTVLPRRAEDMTAGRGCGDLGGTSHPTARERVEPLSSHKAQSNFPGSPPAPRASRNKTLLFFAPRTRTDSAGAELPRVAVVKRGFPGRKSDRSPAQVCQRVVPGCLPRSAASLSTRDRVSDLVKDLGDISRPALDPCGLVKREQQIVGFGSLLLDRAISDV